MKEFAIILGSGIIVLFVFMIRVGYGFHFDGPIRSMFVYGRWIVVTALFAGWAGYVVVQMKGERRRDALKGISIGYLLLFGLECILFLRDRGVFPKIPGGVVAVLAFSYLFLMLILCILLWQMFHRGIPLLLGSPARIKLENLMLDSAGGHARKVDWDDRISAICARCFPWAIGLYIAVFVILFVSMAASPHPAP